MCQRQPVSVHGPAGESCGSQREDTLDFAGKGFIGTDYITTPIRKPDT
jgi:hypothetical protein